MIDLKEDQIFEEGNIEMLKTTLKENKGEIQVCLELASQMKGLKLGYNLSVGYRSDLIRELKELPVVESVRIY